MKRYLSRILISTIPTLVALVVVGVAYAKYDRGEGGFTLGVDLVGGTILVYEVDDTKTRENFKAEDLAAALKRRIDPADLYNITIRPVPTNPPRVEIILPTGGQHQATAERRNWDALLEEAAREYPVDGKPDPYARVKKRDVAALNDAIVKANPKVDRKEIAEWVDKKTKNDGDSRRNLTGDDVERIKDLISRQGQLEFRYLANGTDDGESFTAASATLAKASKEDLERLAVRAEPPPPPRREEGGYAFTVRLGQVEEEHTYSWMEIGKSQLHDLHLDSESLRADPAGAFSNRARVEGAIKDRTPFNVGQNLVYVREIPPGGWSRRLVKDREKGKTLEFFYLVRNSERGKEITGDYLTRASAGTGNSGKLAIHFTLNNAGGNLFYEASSRNKPANGIRRQLAIIFDGQIMSAPNIESAIRTSGEITGTYTQNDVNEMVRILRAGALPATLKKDPVSENSMGPTLGASTIKWGAISVAAAFAAVLAFMVFYYRVAGIVACVALLSNLLLTVAFMVLVKAAFTLPGLAGLVLMLGMAVDANVLIYERLREERERGASFSLALRNGYDRALPTILDTHLTSIFTAIVLYVVGNDQLKGFGISLTVGLIISLFTSLYMTRTIFEVLLAKGLRELNFFPGLVNLIHSKYWDFMSIRRAMFTLTAVLTLLGAGLFIYRADSKPGEGKATVLNIDFTGGTAYTGRLQEPMSLKDIQDALASSSAKLPDLSVEQLWPGDGSARTGDTSEYFTVRTSNKDSRDVLKVISDSLKGVLRQIQLSKYTLKEDKSGMVTEAVVHFGSNEGDGYASQAQVSRLFGDACEHNSLPRSLVAVDKPDDPEGVKEKDDHYSELRLLLSDPTPAAKVREVIKEVQEDFRQQPQPERLEIFDQQLANNTQSRALYAILASWAAILLYLWFRFGSWTFGAAAVVCLIHDLFFTLGAIAACHYIHGTWFGNALGIGDFKIDLPSIAALLTLVGYSVSDTIVVFDRIREVRGKNPSLTYQMVNDSVNQTLTRTILASTTVFVVVLVLYIFGGEGVKLFAFVMIVGVLVGTYSSIYIASPLLLIFGEGKPAPGQIDRASAPSSTAISKA